MSWHERVKLSFSVGGGVAQAAPFLVAPAVSARVNVKILLCGVVVEKYN
jgi:hypothetical protein